MSIVYDEISTRDAFGRALLKYARKDESVYVVSADTEKSMGFSPFAREFPKKAINVGIAEQNMTLVGAGLASCGAKVFVATYAPFASMRILEQVRTFCAYTDLDVKVVSGLSGLSGNIEGVTHQGLEDISILRAIPNMVVVVPADAASTEVITEEIAKYKGPVYLRIGRGPVPKVFDGDYSFKIGKANIIKEEGTDATIIFNGVTANRVLGAEKLLREKGYNIQLIEMPCVKPIDKDTIINAAKKTRAVITVEENNIIGGLGGAVAEVLGENYPTLMKRIGIDDIYTESGTHNDLLDKYNFSPDYIEKAVIETIYKKNANL